MLSKLIQLRNNNPTPKKGIWQWLFPDASNQQVQDLDKRIRFLDKELSDAGVPIILGGQALSGLMSLAGLNL